MIIAWNRILVDGLMTSGILTVFVLSTMFINYRWWLHDFPKSLQDMLPPKTAAEKRASAIMAIPFFALVTAAPVVSLYLAQSDAGAQYSFLQAWLHAYLIWEFFNLFDLLIIDWIGTSLINPEKPPFPGTAGSPAYRDYKFHFVGFLKGTVMGIPFTLLPAGIFVLFW